MARLISSESRNRDERTTRRSTPISALHSHGLTFAGMATESVSVASCLLICVGLDAVMSPLRALCCGRAPPYCGMARMISPLELDPHVRSGLSQDALFL